MKKYILLTKNTSLRHVEFTVDVQNNPEIKLSVVSKQDYNYYMYHSGV